MQTTASTLTSLVNPAWSNEEKTTIDCIITISTLGDEQLPFTADSNDSEAHGRAIFARIVSGEFGPIGEYVPVDVLPAPIATDSQPIVSGTQTL